MELKMSVKFSTALIFPIFSIETLVFLACQLKIVSQTD